MRITIIGGGNVGTQLACHGAEKGNSVVIFTSKPERFSKELIIVNENNEELHRGSIELLTSDPKKAFSDADLIIVTVPAFAMEKAANEVYPYLKAGTKICLVPGTGAGECSFARCIKKGAIIMGLQRVPSIARLVEYGRKVKATGYRDKLYVAALPHKYTSECAKIISELLDMDCGELPSYLNLTLTPSNPILHTTRLKCLYNDYKEGVVYDKVPLFYEEWSDETSELLLKCDKEVQKICRALKDFDLSFVKPLKVHYESDTIEQFTNKIRNIQGFKGLTSPTIKVNNGYIPDFNSRYFTADFNYGLAILIEIADMLNVEAPNMKKVMNWYSSIIKNNNEYFSYSKYGIKTLEDFIKFYSK